MTNPLLTHVAGFHDAREHGFKAAHGILAVGLFQSRERLVIAATARGKKAGIARRVRGVVAFRLCRRCGQRRAAGGQTVDNVRGHGETAAFPQVRVKGGPYGARVFPAQKLRNRAAEDKQFLRRRVPVEDQRRQRQPFRD